jgi:hypothetical protein
MRCASLLYAIISYLHERRQLDALQIALRALDHSICGTAHSHAVAVAELLRRLLLCVLLCLLLHRVQACAMRVRNEGSDICCNTDACEEE